MRSWCAHPKGPGPDLDADTPDRLVQGAARGHKYPRRIRIRPGVVARPERLLRVVTGSIIRSLLGQQAIKLHTSPRERVTHVLTRIPVATR